MTTEVACAIYSFSQKNDDDSSCQNWNTVPVHSLVCLNNVQQGHILLENKEGVLRSDSLTLNTFPG